MCQCRPDINQIEHLRRGLVSQSPTTPYCQRVPNSLNMQILISFQILYYKELFITRELKSISVSELKSNSITEFDSAVTFLYPPEAQTVVY